MSLEDYILVTLTAHGDCARDYLAFLLESPRTTIYDHLAKLEKLGKVEKITYNNNQKGRPITLWRVVK